MKTDLDLLIEEAGGSEPEAVAAVARQAIAMALDPGAPPEGLSGAART